MIATAIICTRNRYQDLLRCLESLARHLDVAQADAVEYLQTTSLKFDGIFCGHVIEHLSAERGESLIKAGAAALRSNGVRIVVTDDPGAWRTLADWFWRDLTHVRFYPLSLLRELFEHQGFRLLACGPDPDTLIPKHG